MACLFSVKTFGKWKVPVGTVYKMHISCCSECRGVIGTFESKVAVRTKADIHGWPLNLTPESQCVIPTLLGLQKVTKSC